MKGILKKENPARVERPPQDGHRTSVASGPDTPIGWEAGLKIEHVLLSVTIAHESSIMQYDDSCAYLIKEHLKDYKGIKSIAVEVHYNHGKTETHIRGCDCGKCTCS